MRSDELQNRGVSTIIFDGDNTLFECGKYYLDAERAFGDAMRRKHGVKAVLASKILADLDVTSTKLDEGFSRKRYPRSFRAASYAMDAIFGCTIDYELAEQMNFIAEAVFEAPYTLYPGVWTSLMRYKNHGWRLILITKGDQEVQRRKIVVNHLDKIFEAEDIYIVEKKSESILEDILYKAGIDTEHTYMVGDSMKDDIGPALALGLTTIHIDSRNSKWGYEDIEHTPHHILRSVARLPSVLRVNQASKYATIGT